MTDTDGEIEEPSQLVRDATLELHRALTKLVAAKFDCTLAELAETDIGQRMQTGHALISYAGTWPDFSLRLALCEAGKPTMELLEVTLPREAPPPRSSMQ